MKADWFVAWVATGQEEILRAKIEAFGKVDRVLSPTAKLWKRTGGAWVQEEQLLFPGYLFIHCCMDSEVYYAIKELPGVLGWLGRDTLWPSTVREDEMERVLLLCQGADPRDVLADVTTNKRQRRGYGVMMLKGQEHRIPFNIYMEDAEGEDKQAETAAGDASPECGGADQRG